MQPIESPNVFMVPSKEAHSTNLDFLLNRKLFYLSIQTKENFPDFKILLAPSCNIKEVSKLNFQKLSTVKKVWLQSNLIKTIPERVFDFLETLTQISLGEFFFIFRQTFQVLSSRRFFIKMY